ncbi:phosphatidylcholine and lysophosphatidylcholine phospholipase, partial [Nowakowskiella sp. JEL0078]
MADENKRLTEQAPEAPSEFTANGPLSVTSASLSSGDASFDPHLAGSSSSLPSASVPSVDVNPDGRNPAIDDLLKNSGVNSNSPSTTFVSLSTSFSIEPSSSILTIHNTVANNSSSNPAANLLSYNLTVRIGFWAIAGSIFLVLLIIWIVVRYILLTKYSRLPQPPRPAEGNTPFDLEPNILVEDEKIGQGYPDEFMSAFLSSIKVFGYLDRPVFHELARHLQTKKLKAGQILFDADDDDRNFYVVVDGVVQTFVKETVDDTSEFAESNDNVLDSDDNSKIWPGHRLLNEVKSGGTVSSLFSILSVFTDDLELPQGPFLNSTNPLVTENSNTEKLSSGDINELSITAEILLSNAEKMSVFPGLVRSSSNTSIGALTSPNEFLSPIEGNTVKSLSPRTKNKSNVVARALTDTTLAVIPSAAFQKLTEKFPNAAAHIVQVILTRFQRVTFVTLYRYLGLSRELLKIEKQVNEFAEFSIPEDMFAPGILQRLRDHHEKIYENAELKTPIKTKNADLISQGIGKDMISEDVTLPPDYLPPKYPTNQRKFSIPNSIRGRLPSTTSFADLTQEEYRKLKVAVFKCISGVIGMSSRHERILTASPPGSPRRGRSFGPSQTQFSLNSSTSASPSSSNSDINSPILLNLQNTGSALRSSSMSSVKENSNSNDANDIRIFFFDKGSSIINERDRVKGLYFVIDGALEVSMMTSKIFPHNGHGSSLNLAGVNPADLNGERKSLFLIKPGGLAGYLSALTGHPSSVNIRAQKDTIVGFLPKSVLDRHVERHPNILMCLAKRLIMHLPPLIFQIDIALEWDQLNAGQILCHQNELADSIYIVLNGRLRSVKDPSAASKEHFNKSNAADNFTRRNNSSTEFTRIRKKVELNTGSDNQTSINALSGSMEVLGEYGQGESVGELEVLMDFNRPGTVYAIRDTEVTIMPKTLFAALASRYPHVAIQLSRIVVSRFQTPISHLQNLSTTLPRTPAAAASAQKASVVSSPSSNFKSVALIPVSSMVPITEFSARLLDSLRAVGERVSYLDTETVMAKLGRNAFNRLGRLKMISWLAEQEENHRLVLYVADGGVSSPWTQRCIRQADCIFIVGLGDGDSGVGEFERLLLGMKTTARKELILLHAQHQCIPGSTAEWLKNRHWIHTHHHVEMSILNSPQTMIHQRNKNFSRIGLASQFQHYYTTARRKGLLRSEFFDHVSRIAADITEFGPIAVAARAAATVSGRPHLLAPRRGRRGNTSGSAQLLKRRYQQAVSNYIETDDDDTNSEMSFGSTINDHIDEDFSKNIHSRLSLTNNDSNDDEVESIHDNFDGHDAYDEDSDEAQENRRRNEDAWTSSSPTNWNRSSSPPARASAMRRRRSLSRARHTNVTSDFSRLARRLLNRSVGLVLGGGGARGVAHVGVIRALEEAGIPIDIVGGTSIGSFVGGLYAKNNDYVSVLGRSKR